MTKPNTKHKSDVFDYSARYLLLPSFQSKRVSKSTFEVTIVLRQHNIRAVELGPSAFKAEEFACLKFMSFARQYSTRHGFSYDESESLTVLNAENFVRQCGKAFKPPVIYTVIVSKTGRAKHVNGECWAAQLLANGKRIIDSEILSGRKVDACRFAFLSLAIRIARDQPHLLRQFKPRTLQALPSSQPQQARPARQQIVGMPLDRASVQAMEKAVSQIRALETRTPTGKHRSQSSGDHDEILVSKIFRNIMPDSIISKRSKQLQTQLEQTDKLDDSISSSRKELPMLQHGSNVLQLVKNNQYSIIVGATGSGKTTQVPQILFEDYIRRGEGGKCNIICTQPRRIAATSVARRVAEERRETLAESVGYQVRFDTQVSQAPGSITYCTTGILLKQLQSSADDVFSVLTHIIVDEVHERDIDIDFLLILLKQITAKRILKNKKAPHIVLMSATMDVERFGDYFASHSKDGEYCLVTQFGTTMARTKRP